MYNKEIIFCADNNGYSCFMDKTHPLAHKTGRVYYHRHVASIKLGRWLHEDEQIHHIDENRKNNEPSNLQVCTATEHSLIHKGKILEKVCPNCKEVFKPDNSTIVCCSRLCATQHSVKNKDITKELLDELIPLHSWVFLGSMFGYSDNGIKKRAKALGCNIKRG